MTSNQRGITVVELIAGLALVCVIVTIVWTALMLGMRHGATETGKTVLQQDANLMIHSLAVAHRGNEKYSIIFEDDQLKINSCDEDGLCKLNVIESRYDFTGSKVNETFIDTSAGSPVIIADLMPKKANTEIMLKITSLNNVQRTLTISTTLSRLLTN